MDSYKLTIIKNPRIAAEVEAIIRWSSYLIATKKSPIIGELLSSGANLLQMCNDIILRGTHLKLKLDLTNCATQLKTFLSVIQSVELLAEIYGREYYGTVGKWAIITAIQIAKATIKLVLLLVYDEGITRSQPIVPLDRIHFAEIVKLQDKFSYVTDETETQIEECSTPKSIKLKSSGRKMRSITESPTREARFTETKTHKQPSGPFERLQKQRLTLLLERYLEQKSAVLTERQLYGELLHIARPIAHLALMGTFGTKSWMSYLVSLTMDVSSLYMIRPYHPSNIIPTDPTSMNELQTIPKNYQFNFNERMELGQRASSLLLYLMRSPFFDQYTKQRAIDGLATSAESIPLIGNFIATFFNYIPDWQQDYFRVWSD